VKAVITAGGRLEGEYARIAGTTIKALAPVRGTTMLDRIIDALHANGIEEIGVVGGREVRHACGNRIARLVPDAGDGERNLLAALTMWPEDGDALIYAASDMPYVDGPALASFLDRVRADTLAMPLADYTAFTARFPGAPPFGITLGGERVVNGGVFHIPAGTRNALQSIALAMFSARKRPWRMATVAGPVLLARFVVRRLSIEHIERRAGILLDRPAQAVRACAPELSYDADTIDEYRYACNNP
jgi:CTP:molybdopterin cytidylyltransferase MocA